MNWKTFLLRLGGLIVLTLLGGALYAIIVNILIMMGLTPTGEGSEGFGKVMTMQSVYIYLGAIVAGFTGMFIKEDWRWVLYLCPLYAPSVFAIIYTVIHH